MNVLFFCTKVNEQHNLSGFQLMQIILFYKYRSTPTRDGYRYRF